VDPAQQGWASDDVLSAVLDNFLDEHQRVVRWRPFGAAGGPLKPHHVFLGRGDHQLEVALAAAAHRPKVADVRALWRPPAAAGRPGGPGLRRAHFPAALGVRQRLRPSRWAGGFVFCARVADHPRVQFRWVEPDGPDGPVSVEDTLACLAQARLATAAPRVLDATMSWYAAREPTRCTRAAEPPARSGRGWPGRPRRSTA
jgi:hypothetical protein